MGGSTDEEDEEEEFDCGGEPAGGGPDVDVVVLVRTSRVPFVSRTQRPWQVVPRARKAAARPTAPDAAVVARRQV